MEKFDIYKEFYSDKTIDELRFSLKVYKSRLDLLNREFEFFRHLLNSKMCNPKTPNLIEKFDHFKQQMEHQMKLNQNLLDEIERQNNEVGLKLECDELSCDNYFVRENYNLELEVVNFLAQTDQLKSEMMAALQSLII